jgi:hypothetical protein
VLLLAANGLLMTSATGSCSVVPGCVVEMAADAGDHRVCLSYQMMYGAWLQEWIPRSISADCAAVWFQVTCSHATIAYAIATGTNTSRVLASSNTGDLTLCPLHCSAFRNCVLDRSDWDRKANCTAPSACASAVMGYNDQLGTAFRLQQKQAQESDAADCPVLDKFASPPTDTAIKYLWGERYYAAFEDGGSEGVRRRPNAARVAMSSAFGGIWSFYPERCMDRSFEWNTPASKRTGIWLIVWSVALVVSAVIWLTVGRTRSKALKKRGILVPLCTHLGLLCCIWTSMDVTLFGYSTKCAVALAFIGVSLPFLATVQFAKVFQLFSSYSWQAFRHRQHQDIVAEARTRTTSHVTSTEVTPSSGQRIRTEIRPAQRVGRYMEHHWAYRCRWMFGSRDSMLLVGLPMIVPTLFWIILSVLFPSSYQYNLLRDSRCEWWDLSDLSWTSASFLTPSPQYVAELSTCTVCEFTNQHVHAIPTVCWALLLNLSTLVLLIKVANMRDNYGIWKELMASTTLNTLVFPLMAICIYSDMYRVFLVGSVDVPIVLFTITFLWTSIVSCWAPLVFALCCTNGCQTRNRYQELEPVPTTPALPRSKTNNFLPPANKEAATAATDGSGHPWNTNPNRLSVVSVAAGSDVSTLPDTADGHGMYETSVMAVRRNAASGDEQSVLTKSVHKDPSSSISAEPSSITHTNAAPPSMVSSVAVAAARTTPNVAPASVLPIASAAAFPFAGGSNARLALPVVDVTEEKHHAVHDKLVAHMKRFLLDPTAAASFQAYCTASLQFDLYQAAAETSEMNRSRAASVSEEWYKRAYQVYVMYYAHPNSPSAPAAAAVSLSLSKLSIRQTNSSTPTADDSSQSKSLFALSCPVRGLPKMLINLMDRLYGPHSWQRYVEESVKDSFSESGLLNTLPVSSSVSLAPTSHVARLASRPIKAKSAAIGREWALAEATLDRLLCTMLFVPFMVTNEYVEHAQQLAS